jgi:hypothetical protein
LPGRCRPNRPQDCGQVRGLDGEHHAGGMFVDRSWRGANLRTDRGRAVDCGAGADRRRGSPCQDDRRNPNSTRTSARAGSTRGAARPAPNFRRHATEPVAHTLPKRLRVPISGGIEAATISPDRFHRCFAFSSAFSACLRSPAR